MELLYLYFKDFQGISNQNLNFGGPYLFHYFPAEKKLEITRNHLFIEGFFNDSKPSDGHANIVNVTGIIAGNGTGKTTILNFILNSFPSGSGGIESSVIFAYQDGESKKVYHFDDIEVMNGGDLEYGFELETISRKNTNIPFEKPGVPDFQYSTPPKVRNFERTDFIYFSNIFNGSYIRELKGIYNISTNYLVRHDLISDIENKLISSDTHHGEIDNFLNHDLERQVHFIHAYQDRNLLPFEIPEMLTVSTMRDYSEYDYCFDSSDRQILEKYHVSPLVQHIFNAAKYHTSTAKDVKEKSIIYFATASLVNFLYELASENHNLSIYHFDFAPELFDNKLLFRHAAVGLLEKLEDQARGFQNWNQRLSGSLSGAKVFIKKIEDYIDRELVINGGGTSFAINIKEDPRRFFSFQEDYQLSYLLKAYLKFAWREMSTGELAFLNIFSRFYSVAVRQRKFQRDERPRDMVILIDEGEVYLHPTWQKRFLKMILDFLPELFGNIGYPKRNIQIIFATNSPIPASDLPNPNIIFLERTGEQILVKDSLEDRKRTFSANISTLLSDSFFMREGIIGDFAKSKINRIIHLLQGPYKYIEMEKDDLQTVINLIGEPIIRNKLLQMLNDRLTVKLLNVDGRIKYLEDELRKLKGES